jgi:copper chaperone
MTATYSVPDVHCGHCQHAITTSVAAVPGVVEVTVDLDTKLVTVDGAADDDAVRAAIEDAGYAVA